jgi:hypothetical protein
VVDNREAGEFAAIEKRSNKTNFHSIWLPSRSRIGKWAPIVGN